MPTTFSKADEEAIEILGTVIKQYHQDLDEVEIRICLMMAQAAHDDHGETIAPALKLHGCECAAIASIIPYKQRAAGAADVRIDIDADKWESMNEDERISLLDHECNHFELQRDDEGGPKSDDCGRPKIKMRPHDFEVGWFHRIARTHGAASLEVKQAKAFADEFGQTYFAFAEAPGPDLDGEVAKGMKAAGLM